MKPILLFLCALLLWGTSTLTRTPHRQQELRVLITARNMVEHQDWLHFEFQNQPRYRKPPLAYWVAATGFTLTGQTTSAWAGRLFFVIAALGGLWVFRALAGDQAALLFLFTVGSLVYAPLAETDFLQLVGLILAFWGWNRSNGWISGSGMAMAVLSKGPGGVGIPLLCFLLLLKKFPRFRSFWIPAVLLPLLAGGGWMAYLQYDPVASSALAADLKATFIDTAHRNPFPYYVWTLPLVMFPAFFALKRYTTSEPHTDRTIALTWFWVTFVLLTLTVSKQRHYALMLLPPACWWVGLTIKPITFSKKQIFAMITLLTLVKVSVFVVGEESKHQRFLKAAHLEVVDSTTLHVVGINSAVFDFHLGRHVENTDSVQVAYNRAKSGDAVVLVQKATSWEEPEGLPAPILEQDDDTWFRRMYKKK